MPKWTKFDAKSYKTFRPKFFHYLMNNGDKTINEVTTIECKDQSDMFFLDLFGNSDVDIMKICDKHFRIDTKQEILKKLKKLSMSDRHWFPDLEKYEEYCINFKKLLTECNPDERPNEQELLYVFTKGVQPQIVVDSIKSAKINTVREAAIIGLEKCREFSKAESITNSYQKEFQRRKWTEFDRQKFGHHTHQDSTNNSKYGLSSRYMRSSSKSSRRSRSRSVDSTYFNRNRDRSRSRDSTRSDYSNSAYRNKSSERSRESSSYKNNFFNSRSNERNSSDRNSFNRDRDRSSGRSPTRPRGSSSQDREQSGHKNNREDRTAKWIIIFNF